MIKRRRSFFKTFFAVLGLVVGGLVVDGVSSAHAVVYPGVLSVAREAAGESVVLLKNENDTLPLKSTDTVSMFGRVQVNSFYGGYGSGSLSKAHHKTSILDGIKQNSAIRLNQDLVNRYVDWTAKHPVSGSPNYYEEMELTNDQVAEAAAASDVALVVIGRAAGEHNDTTVDAYELRQAERTLLDQVTANFDEVVVVLNIGNVMDMTWVDDYPQIKSLVIAWQAGMETGPAVADVLSGDVNPSAKLSDTVAKNVTDYPASGTGNFSNGALTNNGQYSNYVEDIFVGYRYFETFAKDRVQYPFGFGLSYTTFDVEATAVEENESVNVTFAVTNSGSRAGKEVVQVYYGAPQGKLGKASKSLAAFAKTNTLLPGETEEIKVSFPVEQMASYDDGGYTSSTGGAKSAYVLEAGDYPIFAGTSVSAKNGRGGVKQVLVHNEPSTRVVEQLSEALAVEPGHEFDRWHAVADENGSPILEKTGQETPVRTVDVHDMIIADLEASNRGEADENWSAKDLPYGQGAPASGAIQLIDVATGDATMDEFIAQMSLEELTDLVSGSDQISGATAGNTSVYGGVTAALRDVYGIAIAATTDGPAGMRISDTTSQIPSGAALAATWNAPLVEKLLGEIAEEMLLNGSDTLLTPGMNIHRDPLCGRNFEYFSEDPLLTGRMGSAVVRGIQAKGGAASPKHVAVNNQEYNRRATDSRISERALREIYLKGFEIVTKEANPETFMTSYNKINGVHAFHNYELDINILRKEWGFDGAIMTDWWVNVTNPVTKQPEPSPYGFDGVAGNASRVRGGNDILKPGQDQKNIGEVGAAAKAGKISVGEIQRAAKKVLTWNMHSALFTKTHDLELYKRPAGTPVFETEQEVKEAPSLISLSVDGAPLANFAPDTLAYTVFAPQGVLPVVEAAAETGAKVEITQATEDTRRAIVVVTKQSSQRQYVVNFSDGDGFPVKPGGVEPALSSLSVDGKQVSGFNPKRTDYQVKVASASDAVVAFEVADGATAQEQTRIEGVARVRVESPDGARVYRIELVESTQSQNAPESDNFDDEGLNRDLWIVENEVPEHLSQEGGALNITADPGDWYNPKEQSAGNQKNVVWQRAEGDWSAVTKINLDGGWDDTNWQQVGVIVGDSWSNYLQAVLHINSGQRQWGTKNQVGNGNTARWDSYPNDSSQSAIPGTNKDGKRPTVYFRINKVGEAYSFYGWGYVQDENPGYRWVKLGGTTFKRDFSEPKVGFFTSRGGNGGTEFTASVDWIRFSTDTGVADQIPPSDDFEGDQPWMLNEDVWTIINADSNAWSKPEGAVRITSGSGEWYRDKETLANLVSMDVPGNWEMTTKVKWDNRPSVPYQQLGLTLFDSSENFVQFLLECQNQNGTPRLSVKSQIDRVNDAKGVAIDGSSRDLLPDVGEGTMLMKITKEEFAYKFAASFDDGRSWVHVPFAENPAQVFAFENPKLGLTAISPGTTETFTADFEYVHFTDIGDPHRVIAAEGTTVIKAFEDATYLSEGLSPEQTISDPKTAGHHLAYIEPGRWSQYEVTVEKEGMYEIAPRVAVSRTAPEVSFTFESSKVKSADPLRFVHEGGTGGWQAFADLAPQQLYLDAGEHRLMFTAETNGMNLAAFSITPVDSEVDKTELEAAVEEAKQLDSSVYTAASWALVEEALSAAEATLADESATQAEVDAALEALNDAVNALEESPVVNKDQLAALVADCEALSESDYTAESWATLVDALENAKVVLEDDQATQEQILEAYNTLKAAKDNLVSVTVDKSELATLLESAEKYAEEGYTAQSWQSFATAKELAAGVYANPDATQAEVDAAVQELAEAIDALVESPGVPAPNALTLALSALSAEPGDKVSFTGTGVAGETVDIRFAGTSVATSQVQVTGDYSGEFMVPDVTPGTYQIVATEMESGRSVTVDFIVPEDDGLPGEPLTAEFEGLVEPKLTAGSPLTINGLGATPAGRVEVELHSTPVKLGEVVSDGAGAFRLTVLVPEDTAPGEHEVVITDTETGRSVTLPLTVLGQEGAGGEGAGGEHGLTGGSKPGNSSGGEVAMTGASIYLAVLASLALFAVGGGLVVRYRKANK